MIHATVTLNQELSFQEALQNLLDGRCIGIRPGDNTSYLELYKPTWMRAADDYMLRWHGTKSDLSVRTSQFSTPTWKLVIIDHRKLITPSEPTGSEAGTKTDHE